MAFEGAFQYPFERSEFVVRGYPGVEETGPGVRSHCRHVARGIRGVLGESSRCHVHRGHHARSCHVGGRGVEGPASLGAEPHEGCAGRPHRVFGTCARALLQRLAYDVLGALTCGRKVRALSA